MVMNKKSISGRESMLIERKDECLRRLNIVNKYIPLLRDLYLRNRVSDEDWRRLNSLLFKKQKNLELQLIALGCKSSQIQFVY